MRKTKHESEDYDPLKVEDRPTGFEKSAEKFSGELATPKESTPLDSREFLSNIPAGMEVELSLMNGISDIVEAHLKEFSRMEGENLTNEEKTELKIAISGMRSIQKHLYQNWMGQKGWRAEHLVRGLEAVAVTEGNLRPRDEKKGLKSRLKELLS